MTKKKQKKDDRIRISPTAIGMWKLCQRKWAFRYVDKLEQPKTDKMQFGTDVHAQIERWELKKVLPDESPAGMVARQGIKPGFLPTPDPSLTVEGWIEVPIPEVHPKALFIGYRDLCIPADLGRLYPIVIDHKTTTSKQWMKTEEQLRKDEQALIYVRHAMDEAGTDEAMVRWIYYIASNPKQGPRKPKGVHKVEVLFERHSDAFQGEWDKLLGYAVSIVEAKDTFVGANESAPYDLDGCSAYGGCLFRPHCDLPTGSRVAALISKYDRQHQTQPTEEPTMPSLFDKLKGTITGKTAEPTEPEVTGDAAEANASLIADLKKSGDATGVNPPVKDDGDKLHEDDVASLDVLMKESRDELTKRATLLGIDVKGLKKEPIAVAMLKHARKIAAETETDDPGYEGKEAVPGVEACPHCKKEFKQLARHRCPEKPPEIPESEQQAPAEASDATPTTNGAMIVCFDCLLRKGPARAGAVRELTDWIKPLEQHVAKENEVEHWSLIPYAGGAALLAAKFDAYLQHNPVNGYLHVDSYSAVGKALKDVLIAHATIVLQGIR